MASEAIMIGLLLSWLACYGVILSGSYLVDGHDCGKVYLTSET